MAGTTWEVAANSDGMTITSDRFQFTTNSTDTTQLGTVIADLQHITRDPYGQYCGLARAAEMIGERWGLLILRDLLVSPKTVAQLRWGLPRISDDVLAMRLREMEFSGVVRRQDPSLEPDGAVYELTEYGRSVEDALLTLSRWGAMSLATPRPEDILTEDSLVMALRSTFHAEAALDVTVSFELQVAEIVVHAVVDHGDLMANPGPLADADVVIHSGSVLKGLLAGEVTVADAIATGQLVVSGDTALLPTFLELFHLPAAPAPAAA